MQITTNQLDFVTIEGLLAYGERFAQWSPGLEVRAPAVPVASNERAKRAHDALDAIRLFVHNARNGFSGAGAYREARPAVIRNACGGDDLVFFAAWNKLVAEGALHPLLRAPIGSVLKSTHRRPVAIVPRNQLTPQLPEGRIVLDLGDDRFWLLPRDLTDRTLLFTMRHGISRVESKTHVGRASGGYRGLHGGLSRARHDRGHPAPCGCAQTVRLGSVCQDARQRTVRAVVTASISGAPSPTGEKEFQRRSERWGRGLD